MKLLLCFQLVLCASAEEGSKFDDQVSLISEFVRATRHSANVIAGNGTADFRPRFIRGDPPDLGDAFKKGQKYADEVASATNGSVESAAGATADVIGRIADTITQAMDTLEGQANLAEKQTEAAVGRYVKEMDARKSLHDKLAAFSEFGPVAVERFYMDFAPLASVLNSSLTAVHSVLEMAGFMYLAEEVRNDTDSLMFLMNSTVTQLNMSDQVFRDVRNLTGVRMAAHSRTTTRRAATTNASVGIDQGLATLDAAMDEILNLVNVSLRVQLRQTFQLLVKHLRATVEGTMEAKHWERVKLSLESITPKVEAITKEIADPVVMLHHAFNTTTSRLRARLPFSSAFRAAGTGALALLASGCSAWLAQLWP